MDDFEFCPGNKSYPALSDAVILATQITGSTTCVLSILGASLIIFTYVAFKDLRTTARQLLASLSVADIIVAVSHFVGLFANYRRFIIVDENGVRVASNSSNGDPVCIIQGAATMFGTVASLLLSMMIAFYLLILTQSNTLKFARRLVPFMYLVSWGVPFVVVAVVGAVRSFGYEPISSPGWCYTGGSTNVPTKVEHIADSISYEVWSFLCFLLLTVLYITLFISMLLRCKGCRRSPSPVRYGLVMGDVKLLFVPLIFFLLRIWTAVSDAGLHYTSPSQEMVFKCSQAAAVIGVLAGIGLNAQGFANSILFCACTRQIREQLTLSFRMSWQRLKLLCTGHGQHYNVYLESTFSAEDESVKVLINSKQNYGSSLASRNELSSTLTIE